MRILFATAALAALLSASPASAAPGDVVACPLYGSGWFYIPGTPTCVNANTGETRWQTPDGTAFGETEVAKQAKDANEGVALSLALPAATIDDGKTFGAAVNFGTFNGESAVGVGGAFAPGGGLTFNGAVGVGLGRGTAGGRAGVNFSW